MPETKHLTVMFTDIKGFTAKTSLKKREELDNFLKLHENLIAPIFSEFKGTVVKTIGDAFMVVFHSPTNAVLCGTKIQDILKKYNEKHDEKVEVRVAINSGEVNSRGNDYFGEAVNIAARIEGIAEANEVYFTESVYLAMNKNEIPSAAIGYRKLKGIPEEIKVYKVLNEGEKRPRFRAEKVAEEKEKKSFWKKYKGWIISAIVLLIIIVIASNPQNIIKKESNIDRFISNAENVIKSGNYEQAKNLAGSLEKLQKKEIPPKLAVEGAKLYVFLREPENAVGMIKTARANMPTEEEQQQIDAYVAKILEKVSPEQKANLTEMLK